MYKNRAVGIVCKTLSMPTGELEHFKDEIKRFLIHWQKGDDKGEETHDAEIILYTDGSALLTEKESLDMVYLYHEQVVELGKILNSEHSIKTTR